ncbi:MAG: hypothetical protein ACP5MH_11175 [Thermoproteus sp.]
MTYLPAAAGLDRYADKHPQPSQAPELHAAEVLARRLGALAATDTRSPSPRLGWFCCAQRRREWRSPGGLYAVKRLARGTTEGGGVSTPSCLEAPRYQRGPRLHHLRLQPPGGLPRAGRLEGARVIYVDEGTTYSRCPVFEE